MFIVNFEHFTSTTGFPLAPNSIFIKISVLQNSEGNKRSKKMLCYVSAEVDYHNGGNRSFSSVGFELKKQTVWAGPQISFVGVSNMQIFRPPIWIYLLQIAFCRQSFFSKQSVCCTLKDFPRHLSCMVYWYITSFDVFAKEQDV